MIVLSGLHEPLHEQLLSYCRVCMSHYTSRNYSAVADFDGNDSREFPGSHVQVASCSGTLSFLLHGI